MIRLFIGPFVDKLRLIYSGIPKQWVKSKSLLTKTFMYLTIKKHIVSALIHIIDLLKSS